MNHGSGRRRRLLVPGVVAIVAATAAAATTAELALIGTIDGRSRFHMRLHLTHGKAAGFYSYDAHRKDISLRGTAAADGSMSIEELSESGAEVARFEGTRDASGRIAGEWRKSGGAAGIPFVADVDRAACAPSDPASAWIGVWTYVGSTQYDSSELTISEANSQSVNFALDTASGGHEGEIAGTARVTGTRARWKDPETGCSVGLALGGDSVGVVTGGDCSSFAAMGAEAAQGEYRRGQSVHQMTLDESAAIGRTTEKALVRLVGSDYLLFLGCFQMVADERDLDGVGAKVVSGGVRGLFTTQEGLIMSTPAGALWAAVIDPESDVVKYYTNDPRWARALPKTIENWRSRFSDKKVVFAGR